MTDSADLDYALLRRVAKREEAALEELFRRHRSRLYTLAYRLLRDHQEAEDALQEVFLKVYQHAASFTPVATVAAWLHRITANHCLNRLRGRQPVESLEEESAAPPADPGPSPLEVLQQADLARRLEALLNALPENQRRALVLKQFGGLTYAEIGEVLGVSAQAVDGLIKRARQSLRQALAADLKD